METDIELTELHDIDVTRQDGVETPASGFSFIVKKAAGGSRSGSCNCCDDCTDGKSEGTCECCPDCKFGDEIATKDVNAVGGINEQPDIDGAEDVISRLYRLIESEAREGAIGAHEACDIELLTCALHLICEFKQNEEWGAEEDDGNEMAKSLLESDAEFLVAKAHRKFSSDERKKLAGENNALPDGSYPIPDADALRRAAILARSGHGDVAAAKRLIARRAKELGVPNPLADNTKKDVTDVPETPEVTKAEGASELTPESVQELIKAALDERESAAEGRIKTLETELDVLKATPIPGGPSLLPSAENAAVRARSEAAKQAAYHRRMADVTSGELSQYHVQKAKALEAAAA